MLEILYVYGLSFLAVVLTIVMLLIVSAIIGSYTMPTDTSPPADWDIPEPPDEEK